MRTLCSSVLALEAVLVLLATTLATSNGSVGNTRMAWVLGLGLMVLLVAAIGTLGSRRGLTVGWILQALVLATSIVVGWTMLVLGLLFAVLWWFAIHLGTRADAHKAG
jgi:hypothetical protein